MIAEMEPELDSGLFDTLKVNWEQLDRPTGRVGVECNGETRLKRHNQALSRIGVSVSIQQSREIFS